MQIVSKRSKGLGLYAGLAAISIFLILGLAFAVFAPSMSNGFALDDQPLAGGEWALQPGHPDPVIGTLHSPAFYFSKFYWWMEYDNDGLYHMERTCRDQISPSA